MQPLDDDEIGVLVRREATHHRPPPVLAAHIMDQVRAANPSSSPVPRPDWSADMWRWLKAVALFGAGAATAWGLALSLLVLPAPESIGEAVADSHVRSLMAGHLADVASSDRHTVKPWFAGKLDFSPPVIDLAAEGAPLIGGRLDYLQGRPVAALVYKSGAHVINVFVWPAPEAGPAGPVQTPWRGYNLVHWRQAGMQAWAVSDMSAAELRAFSALWRERLPAPG